MAGDGDGNRIRCTSLCDCASRFRRTDALGDLRIAHRGARRYLAQRLPHPLLESRAAHVERQVEPQRRRFDEADNPGHEFFELPVAADQLCFREAVLEVVQQDVGVVSERDGAEAIAGGCDQDRAQ